MVELSRLQRWRTSRSDEQDRFEKHIEPEFGDKTPAEISPMEVQRFAGR